MVVIESVHDVPRLLAVAELLNRVWRVPAGHWLFSPDLLRAVAHSGGAVHVAYEGDRPVGAAAAIFSAPKEKAVYSLVAGAQRSDRGVGYALKMAQRSWALSNGVTVMRWTFDPLVGRNARFNLMKLGAVAPEYTVDFYGVIADGVQGSDETDRLTIEWRLDIEPGRPDVESPRLPHDGAPDGGPLMAKDEGGLWCRVPKDIVTLRRADPEQATAWRLAVREVFVPAFADGYVATGMTRDGWYRLERR